MSDKTIHPDEIRESDDAEFSDEESQIDVQDEHASNQHSEDQGADWEARIESLQQELDETNNRLLRQAAELQNFRRRSEEEKTRLVASSKGRVLKPMLEVLDDLERSLEATESLDEAGDAGNAYDSLREGVEMVLRKFQATLDQLGVEAIEAEGEPFNENEHEAVMQQPAPEDADSGMVLQEIQKGYRLGDRVLRHSKVVVASE